MSRKSKLLLWSTVLVSLSGIAPGSVPASAQEVAVLTKPAVAAILDKRPVVWPQGIAFGSYDPHGDFKQQTDVTTEHLFLPWEDVDLETLRAADAYATARGRNLLITVEPWSWDVDWRVTSDQLRQRLLRGEYDANMAAIAKVVSQLKSPVIIRWGQEMEDTSGRFSWAGWPPNDYITAYKRMMDIVRKEAPQAKLMWSPKGLPGLKAYYPGDGYVDLVGLSVFGLEAYDKIEYAAPRTFSEALTQGYKLVAEYNKPIWVAELGYEGSNDYVKQWMDTATLKQAAFPALTEVVYFNDREVHPWPHNLGRPDWRVVRTEAGN